MTSKIKARDVVAGWPKGTSTSKRNSAETQRFMLAMRATLAGWTFETSYAQLVSAELGEKLLYAIGQQEMTDKFRSERFGPSTLKQHQHLVLWPRHTFKRTIQTEWLINFYARAIGRERPL